MPSFYQVFCTLFEKLAVEAPGPVLTIHKTLVAGLLYTYEI
jgi:hypothetical protein